MSRPFPPPTLSAITADDARSVACENGVAEFIRQHRITETAVDTGLLLELAENKEQSIYIKMAAGLSGYGDGEGYGYGNSEGDGYGYGYGNGNGYGDSYGKGNGYGNRYGNGYSNGNGPGHTQKFC